MATNLKQMGDMITVPAPAGGTTSGTGVLIGSLFGIATVTADAGEDVALATTGVFEHAKTSAQAWTVGALVYWDDGNAVMTTTASTNKLVGVAVAIANNPTPTGVVRLNGAFTS